MKALLLVIVLLSVLHSDLGWPRYGRPHPLYGSRARGSVLDQAVLLGMDLNEVPLLSRSGQDLGFENAGLSNIVNHGFPLNARERKKAVNDLTTLHAIGVIDMPEDPGFLTMTNVPPMQDPPDSPPQAQTKQKATDKPNIGRKSPVAAAKPKGGEGVVTSTAQRKENQSVVTGVLPTKTAVLGESGNVAGGKGSQNSSRPEQIKPTGLEKKTMGKSSTGKDKNINVIQRVRQGGRNRTGAGVTVALRGRKRKKVKNEEGPGEA